MVSDVQLVVPVKQLQQIASCISGICCGNLGACYFAEVPIELMQ